MVLLKEACTCAIPSVTMRLIFFFTLAAGLAIRRYPLLFDGFARTLAGTGVGTGALATQRQTATMTQAAIAAEVHQALDGDTHLAAQIAFNRIFRHFRTQVVDLG